MVRPSLPNPPYSLEQKTEIRTPQSGFEIFTATITALEAAAKIIHSILDAVADANELPLLLASHQEELDRATALVASAKSEPELCKRVDVMEAVEAIGAHAVAVERHIRSMDRSGKSQVAKMACQLARGRQAKEILQNLMDHLSRKKASLVALVSVVHISMTRSLTDHVKVFTSGLPAVAATAAAPEAAAVPPAPVADELGPGRGAPIAASTRVKSRIITNNTASGYGFMLNGPLVKGGNEQDLADLYEDVDHLCIDGNQVSEKGTMINYATTINNLSALANDFLLKIREADAGSKTGPHRKRDRERRRSPFSWL